MYESFSIAIDDDFSINMVVPTFILVGEEILNYVLEGDFMNG